MTDSSSVPVPVADASPTRKPALGAEGWFTTGDTPALIAAECTSCRTLVFPPTALSCPNPDCLSTTFGRREIGSHGRIWSYTDARYEPPKPYVRRGDAFVPFAIAAVALDDAEMVVVGAMTDDTEFADLDVGKPVSLVVDVLFEDAEGEHLIWKWRLDK